MGQRQRDCLGNPKQVFNTRVIETNTPPSTKDRPKRLKTDVLGYKCEDYLDQLVSHSNGELTRYTYNFMLNQ